MESEFKGKKVLIVDDSIVRGTTSKEIVNMAKESGATKVYFASAAPAIRYNHIYGIDLTDTKNLIAYNRTDEEVAEVIGCERVIYQSLEDLIDCCKTDKITKFEMVYLPEIMSLVLKTVIFKNWKKNVNRSQIIHQI